MRLLLLSACILSACVPLSTPTATATTEKIAHIIPTETRAPLPILTATPSPAVRLTVARPPTSTHPAVSSSRAPTLLRNSTATRTPSPPHPLSPSPHLPTPTRTNTALPPTASLTLPPSSSGEAYSTLSVLSAPTHPPAASHPDLNLALRGYAATSVALSLIDYTGTVGSGAPQLYGLFADNRTPTFKSAHQVYDWNWSCNCRGALNPDWDVTVLGMATASGESIRLPNSGADIGDGFRALVLYADTSRLTLKYTREDNVVSGFTLQIENVAVDANLLALYQQSNAAGRGDLPALRAGQAMGRAGGDQILVAIRDAGSFLDPRSRKDWWRGR